jgi:dTDP-4-amino-4,6-dideoxygalactose transaminase
MISIPVMRPLLPKASEVTQLLERMDSRRYYSNQGELVRELESSWAEKLGLDSELLVACSSATVGLAGAISISDPSEWLVPAFTFAATAHAVAQAGKRIVLADVDVATWRISSHGVNSASTTGVVHVIPFGEPFNTEAIGDNENVVIDAAASLGSEPQLSDLPATWSVIFSLHATKVAPAGEGGLVAFGSPEKAKLFRSWINFGFAGDRVSNLLGTNGKMSEINAAYGLASFYGWEKEKAQWLERQDSLRNGISKFGKTRLFGTTSPHPYLIAFFDNADDLLSTEAAGRSNSIATIKWWKASLDEMPAFDGVATTGNLEVSKFLAATTLGLPMSRDLSAEAGSRVIDCFSQ